MVTCGLFKFPAFGGGVGFGCGRRLWGGGLFLGGGGLPPNKKEKSGGCWF